MHRGVFLADLPFHIYMARVERIWAPGIQEAELPYVFRFDKHYADRALLPETWRLHGGPKISGLHLSIGAGQQW